jgi:hypothetical protein
MARRVSVLCLASVGLAAAAGVAAAAGPLGAAPAPTSGSLAERVMRPGELRIPSYRASGPVTEAGIAYFRGDTCAPRLRRTLQLFRAEGFQRLGRRFFESPTGGADSVVLRFATAAGARRAMADALRQPVSCAGSRYLNAGTLPVPGVPAARGVLRAIRAGGDAGRGAVIVLARGRILYQTGIEEYGPRAADPGPLLAAAARRWLRRVAP